MITITLFQDGNVIVGADYSNRENAIGAFIVSDESVSLLEPDTKVKYEDGVLTFGKKKIEHERIQSIVRTEEVLNADNTESRKDALRYGMDIIRDEIDKRLRDIRVSEILKESTDINFAIIDQLKVKYDELKKEYLQLFVEVDEIVDAETPDEDGNPIENDPKENIVTE